MILSKKFVNDYTPLDKIDFKELADGMLKLGNEYEYVKDLVPNDKLVIGEVKECKPHPESDHLKIVKVDVKDEVLNIICGAPNVREGLKVIVALDGCELPLGVIKKTTIMGVESNGMICSIAELGLDKKFLTEADVNGICELDNDAKVGDNPIEYLELDDKIIDFELTANRADLLSELGLAYESAIITGGKVTLPELTYTPIKEKISDRLELKVDTKDVFTFLVKGVNNIKIENSPLWLKNRLMACGIRSINNVVDISNYVMLELGQPLHFYDADKLGKVLGARNAHTGEKIVTLDNEERILDKDDILIVNDDKPACLAGVMGGLDTEIDENTKNVVIECAIFNGSNIRRTSKKLVRSESSIRYEKGLDVNRTYMAIERACHLLEKYASGSVLSGMLEYNTLSRDEKKVTISLDKINSVLGYTLTVDDVKEVFKKLDFKVKEKDSTFEVLVPTRRIDVNIPEDLIEEVSRVYGVDNIESTLPIFESTPSKHSNIDRIIEQKMVSLGLNEVVTYSLISVNDVFKFTNDEFGIIRVLDPLTEERTVLRHSMITSHLEVYKYNKARNIKDLSIFEISKCFSKINDEYIEEKKLACLLTGTYTEGLQEEKYDFYVVKGIVESLLDYMGYSKYSFVVKELPEEMHPTKSAYISVGNRVVGLFGQVHPKIVKDEVYVIEINLETLLELKRSRVKYKEVSKFPGITKDVAFVLPKEVTSAEVIDTIKQGGGKLLTNVKVFDYYEGDKIEKGKKSIAYSLYFESLEKTLSDQEVLPLFDKIIELVTKKHNAILRDK